MLLRTPWHKTNRKSWNKIKPKSACDIIIEMCKNHQHFRLSVEKGRTIRRCWQAVVNRIFHRCIWHFWTVFINTTIIVDLSNEKTSIGDWVSIVTIQRETLHGTMRVVQWMWYWFMSNESVLSVGASCRLMNQEVFFSLICAERIFLILKNANILAY